ncbi:unnamed protein product [Cuscuta campestris]|uniref:RNase H type-1 domain-containing protein n=1 Tax=Cuscuta campestris TaxID=132261 RepID=A0A484L717_9ASTE|nr:unnamed protein product [Cuscuta campestris]
MGYDSCIGRICSGDVAGAVVLGLGGLSDRDRRNNSVDRLRRESRQVEQREFGEIGWGRGLWSIGGWGGCGERELRFVKRDILERKGSAVLERRKRQDCLAKKNSDVSRSEHRRETVCEGRREAAMRDSRHPIVPSRGLRQGDPISPLLFIICAEGLSFLLQNAESRGLLHGIWVARGKNSRGIHWMAWGRMTYPKKFGGMGFRDISAFNVALLGKQGWRFLTNPAALVSQVFKARYFPKTSFLDAKLGHNPSYCWRSILAAQNLLSSGVRRRVGSGLNTTAWGSPWLLDDTNPCLETPITEATENMVVASFIDSNLGGWNISMLEMTLIPRDVHEVEAFQRGWTDAATSLKSGSSVVAVPGAVFQPNTANATTGGEDRSFRAAVNGRLICVQEPLMAEAMACREALLWLKGKRIRAFKLFTDCLQLVTAIEQRDRGPFSSYLGSLIEDCYVLLSSFESASICFIRRSFNSVAHTLARSASTHRSMWDDTPPELTMDLLVN